MSMQRPWVAEKSWACKSGHCTWGLSEPASQRLESAGLYVTMDLCSLTEYKLIEST